MADADREPQAPGTVTEAGTEAGRGTKKAARRGGLFCGGRNKGGGEGARYLASGAGTSTVGVGGMMARTVTVKSRAELPGMVPGTPCGP